MLVISFSIQLSVCLFTKVFCYNKDPTLESREEMACGMEALRTPLPVRAPTLKLVSRSEECHQGHIFFSNRLLRRATVVPECKYKLF